MATIIPLLLALARRPLSRLCNVAAIVDTGAAVLQPVFGEQGFLNPIIAAAAMAFSSVSVMTNSLRLRNARID